MLVELIITVMDFYIIGFFSKLNLFYKPAEFWKMATAFGDIAINNLVLVILFIKPILKTVPGLTKVVYKAK